MATRAPKSEHKVGTQFVGEIARRLKTLKKQTGLPANTINELIVTKFLPGLESGDLRVVSGPDGPELVESAKIQAA